MMMMMMMTMMFIITVKSAFEIQKFLARLIVVLILRILL